MMEPNQISYTVSSLSSSAASMAKNISNTCVNKLVSFLDKLNFSRTSKCSLSAKCGEGKKVSLPDQSSDVIKTVEIAQGTYANELVRDIGRLVFLHVESEQLALWQGVALGNCRVDHALYTERLAFEMLSKCIASCVSDWEKLDIVIPPENIAAPPSDILQILGSPCPFVAGKIVGQTHAFVLVPQGLALDHFASSIVMYDPSLKEMHGANIVERSHWVLLFKEVLEGSRNQSFASQVALMKGKTAGVCEYEVPRLLDAMAVILIHHVRTSEKLFSNIPWTFTRCREIVAGNQTAIGCFSSHGLQSFLCGKSPHVGLAPARVFL